MASVLLALGFLVFGTAAPDGAGEGVPRLTILEPADGAPVSQPLEVVIATRVQLRPDSRGWGADGRHLHLRVDGIELMPADGDIREERSGRYRWTLPPLPAGEHEIRASWSDATHRPIEAGASELVRVRVQ